MLSTLFNIRQKQQEAQYSPLTQNLPTIPAKNDPFENMQNSKGILFVNLTRTQKLISAKQQRQQKMPDTFFQSMLSLKRHQKNMNLRTGIEKTCLTAKK